MFITICVRMKHWWIDLG